MHGKKGAFTLVEILIVVMILAIVAEIVIPQYMQATANSRQSAVLANLQSIRNQIELYKAQHLDVYPGSNIATVLTGRTNAAGTTGTDPNLYPYGPYILSIPANPYVTGTVSAGPSAVGGTSSSTSNADTTIKTGTSPVPGDGTSGWYWQTNANIFSANDPTNKNL